MTAKIEYTYTYEEGKISRAAQCAITGTNLEIAYINSFRYRSYTYDQEIGMYYLQSRYYDPDTGRFVNADEVIIAVSPSIVLTSNLFMYCYNNSVIHKDVEGTRPVVCALSADETPSNRKKASQYMKDLINQKNAKISKDRLAIAMTIMGECDNRYTYPKTWKKGQEAVAWTIINRYRSSRYPYDWYKIVTAKNQFTGYIRGKKLYDKNKMDSLAWNYAHKLAGHMVHGSFSSIAYPKGFTSKHLNFRQDTGQSYKVWRGVLRIAGNVFFYYA